MEENPISREEYINQVLSAYRRTPGTAGTIRRPDRLLAAQLQERGVPLAAVENALVLAAARRLVRPIGSPPLAPPFLDRKRCDKLRHFFALRGAAVGRSQTATTLDADRTSDGCGVESDGRTVFVLEREKMRQTATLFRPARGGAARSKRLQRETTIRTADGRGAGPGGRPVLVSGLKKMRQTATLFRPACGDGRTVRNGCNAKLRTTRLTGWDRVRADAPSSFWGGKPATNCDTFLTPAPRRKKRPETDTRKAPNRTADGFAAESGGRTALYCTLLDIIRIVDQLLLGTLHDFRSGSIWAVAKPMQTPLATARCIPIEPQSTAESIKPVGVPFRGLHAGAS